MSDFTAWAIADAFAIGFAPWYVVGVLTLGLVVCFVSELP